ncbi:helix-turn-helix domain-containing protein [Priestia filamentosa]|uniref:helix-turn-helix transcriptional regulator n=1 Tax=Priestia filamentosa TaxID=1402861 RepID=UPI000589118E
MAEQSPHKLVNYVSSCIAQYKLVKQSEDLTKRITLKSVEEELAEYCLISRNMVVAIKRNQRQPSLETAILIAQFFNQPMESIFVLKKNETEEQKKVLEGEEIYE